MTSVFFTVAAFSFAIVVTVDAFGSIELRSCGGRIELGCDLNATERAQQHLTLDCADSGRPVFFRVGSVHRSFDFFE